MTIIPHTPDRGQEHGMILIVSKRRTSKCDGTENEPERDRIEPYGTEKVVGVDGYDLSGSTQVRR